MSTFDPQAYTTAPQFDAPNGIALGKALVQAKPANAPANVIKAAGRVDQAIAALQAADDESTAASDSKTHAADSRLSAAWPALFHRLSSYAELPLSEYPRVARASELLHIVFPSRLAFTRASYQVKWAESDKMLKRIADQFLMADVDALCGPEFLAEVRKAHRLFGDALGITQQQASAPNANVAEPLNNLRNELGKYLRAVAGMVDDDPTTQPAVEAALHPVDEFRRKHAPHKSAPAGDSNPAPAPAAAKS